MTGRVMLCGTELERLQQKTLAMSYKNALESDFRILLLAFPFISIDSQRL